MKTFQQFESYAEKVAQLKQKQLSQQQLQKAKLDTQRQNHQDFVNKMNQEREMNSEKLKMEKEREEMKRQIKQELQNER